MGTVPSGTNTAASTVESIINAAVFDLALKAAEVAAIAQAPFLGLPVIKTLFEAFLNWVAGVIYKNLSLVATFVVIDIQTAEQKIAYLKAEGELRAAHLTGDPDAISKAVVDFKTALASLIHFDGSAPTS